MKNVDVLGDTFCISRNFKLSEQPEDPSDRH